MVHRHLWAALGGSLACRVLFALVAAASWDFSKVREKTKELTRKNATSLIGVSSAVPDEVRLEVVEMVQALELSRDRIIHFLDRVDEGMFPPEEGVRRATAVANARAEKERGVLQALLSGVPASVLQKVGCGMSVANG